MLKYQHRALFLLTSDIPFNLETSVKCEKAVQDIDVHGDVEKFVVTLLVIRHFSTLPGASRACADFRDLTEVFRLKL